MRPLHHPAPDDVTVEGILYALSDPVRARIYAAIATSDCPRTCSNFLRLDAGRTLPKSTLSQHFKILREAGLIRSERKGVEMHNTSRCAELRERFGDMLAAILAAYLGGEAGGKPRRRGRAVKAPVGKRPTGR